MYMEAFFQRGSGLDRDGRTMPDLEGRAIHIVRGLRRIFWIYACVGIIAQNGVHGNKDKGGQFCDTEMFRADCPDGQVILLTYARYGRMEIGRCVQLAMGYIGCQSDVLILADRRCSGRRVCDIRVPDAEFESTRPCLKELKTYLDIKYTCVQVESVSSEYCKSHRDLNVSSTVGGFIASIVTSDTPSCDGISHPWVITGHTGQQILLTLYDFALEEPYVYQRLKSHELFEICRQYGIIQDNGREKTATLCGGDKRVSTHFQSTGNAVKLWVTAGSGPKDMKRFIVHYQIIGCRDLELPSHLWFRRTSDGSAIIGCAYSDTTWGILCETHVWSAINDTCSHTDERDDVTFNYGTPVINGFAIVVGGAVGVIIVLLLTTLAVYRRLGKTTSATGISCQRQAAAQHSGEGSKEDESTSQTMTAGQLYSLCNLRTPSAKKLYHQHDQSCRQDLGSSNNEECEYVWQAPFPVLTSGCKNSGEYPLRPTETRTVCIDQYGAVSYRSRAIYEPDVVEKYPSVGTPILSTL